MVMTASKCKRGSSKHTDVTICNIQTHSSPVLPCNLSTVGGPIVEGVSLMVLVLRISAARFGTECNHRLGPRMTAWAMRGWGRLGAFMFRSALVWVVLLVWGRGIVRAFLSSSGALAAWIGLSNRGWGRKNGGKRERKRYHQSTPLRKRPIFHMLLQQSPEQETGKMLWKCSFLLQNFTLANASSILISLLYFFTYIFFFHKLKMSMVTSTAQQFSIR